MSAALADTSAGRQLPRLRRPEPRRRACSRAATLSALAPMAAAASATVRRSPTLAAHLRNARPARSFAHRLSDPVRVHRHVHLRELRARAAAARASPMALGLVYFVFLPSLVTTPLAGRAVARFGTAARFRAALAVAGVGLPLLLLPQLAAVLAGLACVGAGTFFAQAGGDRLRRPRRHRRPRLGQRHVPRQLLLRRPRRRGGGRPMFDRFGWPAAWRRRRALALAAWLARISTVMAPMTHD